MQIGRRLLLMRIKKLSFANKIFAMDRNLIEREFAQFVRILDGPREGYAGLSFPDICARIGVGEKDMDSYLMDNFGLSGSDILKAYEEGIPLYLL